MKHKNSVLLVLVFVCILCQCCTQSWQWYDNWLDLHHPPGGSLRAAPMAHNKRRRIDGNIDSASRSVGEGLIELEVLSMSGECMLTLNVSDSMLGRDLWKMILDKVPSKPGLQLVLSHNTSKLVLHESLQQQGLGSQRAQVSATYMPVNLLAALRFAHGCNVEDEEFIIERNYRNDRGWVTKCLPCCTICQRAFAPWHLHMALISDLLMWDYQPAFKVWLLESDSIRAWTKCHGQQAFNAWLLVRNSIRTWTMWHGQQAFKVWLLVVISIRAWTMWHGQQAFKVWLLEENSIRAWTGSHGQQAFKVWLLVGHFNQSLNKVSWPAGLQSLTFGYCFNQSLNKVSWPAGLQSLTFGSRISIRTWTMWDGQQAFKVWLLESDSIRAWTKWHGQQAFKDWLLVGEVQQNLNNVTWPAGLQSLTFGENFDKNLNKVSWPAGLQSLTFGYFFNQSLNKVLHGQQVFKVWLLEAFQSEPGQRDMASRPSKCDFWSRFQSEPGQRDMASRPSKPDLW